ncbi:Phospholipase A1 member A [Halotydeus destructor]|nr:Phospholipase A1 member A [Halotydeus destructor]
MNRSTNKIELTNNRLTRLSDLGDGCPGISTIFPADSCLGKPTFSSNPEVMANKTSLIFVDKDGNDHLIRYDDFVTSKDIRRKALQQFFYADREVNVLIHGWTDHYYRDGWVWSFKDFILKYANPKSNILIIDWRQWSQSLVITKVKMNVLTVADQLTSVLYMLTNTPYAIKTRKYTASQIYIYGHSYGGHIAGRAAQTYSSFTNGSKIAGLLALDPSDQCFGRGSFESLDGRQVDSQEFSEFLDASAASYVKVIHTDSNAFGAYWRLGSVDVYINQGSGQPDCPVDISSLNNVDALFSIACSHYRATRIMTQAYYNQTNGNCQPVAFRCSSFDDFLGGVCACLFTDRNDGTSLLVGSSGRCRQLASNRYQTSPDGSLLIELTGKQNFVFSKTRDTRDSWYLIMGSEPPYCLGTFLYSIRSSEIPNNVITHLMIDNNTAIEIDVSSRRQGVITIPAEKVGPFKELTISYIDLPGELLGQQRKFHFQTLSLFYMSHVDYCVRSRYTRVYCSYNGDFRISDQPYPNFVSEKGGVPGAAQETEVKFTKERCLDIVNYCLDSTNRTSSLGAFNDSSCVAFIFDFLKDYILALYDQSCATDDRRCARLLECLYGLRYGYDPVDNMGSFYTEILENIRARDNKLLLHTLFIGINTTACIDIYRQLRQLEQQHDDEECQIRLFDF